MKIYAPTYYKDFRCVADKCTHSCCIGWRIELSNETTCKYRAASGSYSKFLTDNIATDDEGSYIPLDSHGRCPHLSPDGLCKIICEYGDGYLSDICREHPRFYNDLGTHVEVGLGASCIEAARIILSSPVSNDAVIVGDDDLPTAAMQFPVPEYRNRIFSLIEYASSYDTLEEEIGAIFAIPKPLLSLENMRRIYSQAEYISEDNRRYITNSAPSTVSYDSLTRMLWYFIYRHLSTAENSIDARARIAFALLSVRATASIYEFCDSIEEALRIYSEEIEYSTDNTDAIIFDLSADLI